MLVLSRKTNETLVVGDNIVITIVDIGAGRVRIGVAAPSEIPVVRGELLERRGIPIPHIKTHSGD